MTYQKLARAAVHRNPNEVRRLAMEIIANNEVRCDDLCEGEEGGCGCTVRFAKGIVAETSPRPDFSPPAWDDETPRPQPSVRHLPDYDAPEPGARPNGAGAIQR